MPKNKPLIIVPYTLPWDWSADFQRQTCLELARRGYRVICYMTNDAHFFLKPVTHQYPQLQNIEFYLPPFYLPGRRIKLIDQLNQSLSCLIFSLRYLFEQKIIWTFDPLFYNFSRFFTHHLTIYDCVDYHTAWSLFEGAEISRKEAQLVDNCDLFFVNSHALQEIHRDKSKKSFLVPQGFNLTEFKANVNQLKPRQPHTQPLIGYVGGISSRIDFDLLISLVKNHPQWQFSLWGPEPTSNLDRPLQTSRKIKILKKLPNVSFNFTTDKLVLMEAINNFDVGLIPYLSDQKNNYLSYPMKTFEYFYLGQPIISTPILELTLPKFKDLIYIETTAAGFGQRINQILQEQWPEKKRLRQKKLAIENSWQRKVGMILQIANHYLDSKRAKRFKAL